MQEAISALPYDFRRPGSLPMELDCVLAAWGAGFRSILPEKWSNYLPAPVEVKAPPACSITAADLRSQLPESFVSYRVAIGSPECSALLILTRPMALAIVSCMVGNAVEQLPEDRALSELESSLVDLVTRDIVDSLAQSSPLPNLPAFELNGVSSRSDTLRFLTATDRFLVLKFQHVASFGEQEFYWVLSRVMSDILAAKAKSTGEAGVAGEVAFDKLILDVPVEIAVQLGRTEVNLSDLAKLRPGDLLMLDQSVTDPMEATIDGDSRFHGWPGRIGSRLAFQIESVEDGNQPS